MKANIKYKIHLKLFSKPTTASTFTCFLNDIAQSANKAFVNINNFTTGLVVFRPFAGNVYYIALLMAWKKGEMKPALRDFIAIVQERLASVTA